MFQHLFERSRPFRHALPQLGGIDFLAYGIHVGTATHIEHAHVAFLHLRLRPNAQAA